jgi:GNAT superfamily N-acetyltransferase
VERHLNLVVRPINRWRMREEADRLYAVYVGAWERNWGFVPPTREEFWHTMKDLQWLHKLGGMLIAEIDGRPVGTTMCVPDVNQVLKGTNGRLWPSGWWRMLNMDRLITRSRAIATGVLPEYQDKGVLPAIMYHLVERSRRDGFREIEFSWILENNQAANETLRKNGGQMYKTYRLYDKAVA